jgi:hypothetical protein
MFEDFAPNFGGKRTSLQRTVSHILFRQGIFNQKEHDCRSPPTLIFFVSQIEDKTERPPFLHN